MLLRNAVLSAVCISSALWADPVTTISKSSAGVTEVIAPNKLIKFDSATVKNYEGNPETIVVPGMVIYDDSFVAPDRSFKDALMQNVDKESMERSCQ